MRAAFAILIIELLIQLPGPNLWRPVALVDASVSEAQLLARAPADVPAAGELPDQCDEERVVKVQLFEDDVVHEDVLLDPVALVSLTMTLRCAPPAEPHLERDIPPPQVARVVRARMAS